MGAGAPAQRKYNSTLTNNARRSSRNPEKHMHGRHNVMVAAPAIVAKTPHMVDAILEELDSLYQGHLQDAKFLRGDRLQAEREVCYSTGSRFPATYGEILSRSFIELLQKVHAIPGQRFYDLGSGTGKTVLLAWRLGLNATGVELVKERYRASCSILSTALQTKSTDTNVSVQFIHADIACIDFSDADIVFANSVCYTDGLMKSIALAAQRLRPGAFLISFGGLSSPLMRQIDRVKLCTSWSPEGTEFIIQKVS